MTGLFLSLFRHFNLFLLIKEEDKTDQHRNSNIGRYVPDIPPLIHIIYGIVAGNKAREPGANKHTQSVSDKCEQSLCRILDPFIRFLFGIHIPGNKEEIVANTMKNNACIQHPQICIDVAKSKA